MLHKAQTTLRHCSSKTLFAKRWHGAQMSTANSIATLFSIISLNRTRFPVKDDGTFSRMSPEPCAAWEGARSVISSSARVARCFLPFSYHSVYFCFLSSSQSGSVWLWSRLLSPTKDSHDNPWIEVHEEGTAWHRNTTRCDSVQRCEQKICTDLLCSILGITPCSQNLEKEHL
jgi:hypothetical protein